MDAASVSSSFLEAEMQTGCHARKLARSSRLRLCFVCVQLLDPRLLRLPIAETEQPIVIEDDDDAQMTDRWVGRIHHHHWSASERRPTISSTELQDGRLPNVCPRSALIHCVITGYYLGTGNADI